MNIEVTICKHDLATGKIDGTIYTVKGEDEKCFDTILDETLRKCGITRDNNCWVGHVEDGDGCGMGYAWYFEARDGIAYRITLIGDEALWDHSFLEYEKQAESL